MSKSPTSNQASPERQGSQNHGYKIMQGKPPEADNGQHK
jgi:hypothetical protein